MTHLSDFSYLERCNMNYYITIYLIYTVWRNDRFNCLRPSKILAGELKSIITVLMCLMMTTQAVWDAISADIKYSEGFMVIPGGKIINKPFDYWTPAHQQPIQAIDYVECVTFSLHTGVFFLLQCFWNYLSNTVAKKSFMGSWEFKFYIFWAMGSMAMMPILQWTQRDNELYREVVPQMAYGIEVLITAALGVRSHFRFRRIIAQASRRTPNSEVVKKLSYFKDMNFLLTCILFSYGSSFVILCSDGLTTAMVINTNKFASDFLISNANVCVILLWLLFISIFHPNNHYANAASTHKSRDPDAAEDDEDGYGGKVINGTNFTEKSAVYTRDSLYARPLSRQSFQMKSPFSKHNNPEGTTFTVGSKRESEAGQSSPTLPPEYGNSPKIPLNTIFSSQLPAPRTSSSGRDSPITQLYDEVSTYSSDVRKYLNDSSRSIPPHVPPTRTSSRLHNHRTGQKLPTGSSPTIAASGGRQDWLWQSPERRNA